MSELLSRILNQIEEFDNSAEGFGVGLRHDLAEVVIELLDERGWTQGELARRAGMYDSQISDLIHSNDNCNFKTVGRVFHALGVRPTLAVRDRVLVIRANPQFQTLDNTGVVHGEAYTKEGSTIGGGEAAHKLVSFNRGGTGEIGRDPWLSARPAYRNVRHYAGSATL